MSDDQFSASELRARYERGGTLSDDQLTASQLRARHAIPHNTRDFSTRPPTEPPGTGSGTAMAVILCAILMVLVLVYFFMGLRSPGKARDDL